MKRVLDDLACFGGASTFAEPLHVGQMNLPSWERFQAAFTGIFERRWFTNHGPLVRELEGRLAEFLGVRHVVCMTNGTLALMLALQAMELEGRVVVPAFTFPATVQALTWAGLDPVFCDVDPRRHILTAELVRPHLGQGVSAVLGVHLWGRACDPEGLAELCRDRGLALLYDAAHAFGCSHGGRRMGCFGAVEVFSFHATKVLNAAEGGCAATNDDALAARLRTIRNFHAGETFAPVDLRLNAKMSEAQAAMALLSLEDYPENAAANLRRYQAYARLLSGLPGVELLPYPEGEENNFQFVVLDIDPERAGLSRDDLVVMLEAENVLARRYFTPGIHRSPPYCQSIPLPAGALPATDRLSERLMQLPSGQPVRDQDVAAICGLLRFLLAHAPQAGERLRAGRA